MALRLATIPLLLLVLHSCSQLPKPEFTIDPEENPESGDSIRFINLSKRGDTYEWEFGDGSFAHTTSPVHVYESAGIFEVKLTADNDAGSNLIRQSVTIYEPTILSFTVYDSTQTRPLENSLVWVYDNAPDRDSLFAPLFSGITDNEGSLFFQNLETMVYHILVQKEEPGGAWNFKGYTNPLIRNKVNHYNVLCIWEVNQD